MPDVPVPTLHLFGPPGGTHPTTGPFVFRERKALALIARLASRPGTPHSRQRLAALLWPDLPDASARRNFRVTLARLNRTLGKTDRPYLVGDRNEVRHDPDSPLVCDAAEFDALKHRCETHVHASVERCLECQERLVRAADLYRGEFLEGFRLDGCDAFDEWRFSEHERLRGVAIEVFATLADGHVERGELAAAERATRRELALDSLRESAHRRLMGLLTRQGRQAAASAHHRDLVELLRRELGVTPDARTGALHERIVRGEMPTDATNGTEPVPGGSFVESLGTPPLAADVLHNLPPERSACIGQETALEQLAGHLRSRRLITLIGIGGIGKTRLALQLARRVLPRFPDGVFVVRLASLAEPVEIPTALAAALGFRLAPGGDATAQLVHHLGQRSVLLIMDNFEHLLEGAPLVTRILEATVGTRIIVTSRQKLDIDHEAVYAVQGLSVERVDGHAQHVTDEQCAASRLFLDAAERVQLGFTPGADELAQIARIGRLVDGHPLALVLAAGWLETISCREIAEELASGIELLETEALDVPERQRSVETAFAYSWELLDASGREVLAALSVFRGGFDRDAAMAVAGASLRHLARLLKRSLIQRQPERERYELHELMRQFAATRLRATGELDSVATRHAEHYLAMLATAVMLPSGATLPLKRLEHDIDNLRAAWLHAVRAGDVRSLACTITALRTYCTLAGRERDLVGLLEPALALVGHPLEPGGPTARVDERVDDHGFELDLLLTLGVAYRNSKGYLDPSLGPLFERAWTLVGTAPSSPELFAVLYGLWSFNLVGGMLGRALDIVAHWRRRIDEAQDDRDADDYLEDARFIVHCLEGPTRHMAGELVLADRTLLQGLARDRVVRRDAIVALYGLNFAVSARYWFAVNRCLLGQLDAALATVGEARHIARGTGQPLALAFAAMGEATVAVLRRDLPTTRRCAAEMQMLVTEHRIGAITRLQGRVFELVADAANAGVETDRDVGPLIDSLAECLDSGMGMTCEDLNGCLLAELLLRAGRLDAAAAQLTRTVAAIAGHGQQRFLAELTRLDAEVQHARGDSAGSTTRFERALALARKQRALLFELRAATGLARLHAEAGRDAAGCALLGEVLERVVEGDGLADVVAARALHDELRALPAKGVTGATQP